METENIYEPCCKYLLENNCDVENDPSYFFRFNLYITSITIDQSIRFKYYHRTPIFCGVHLDRVDIIHKMRNFGLSINKIGRYGKTPLITAVENNSDNSIRYLIENGADINILPIKFRNYTFLFYVLCKYSGEKQNLFYLMEFLLSIPKIQTTINNPIYPDDKISFMFGYMYCLKIIIQEYYHQNLLVLFVKNGANINCIDNNGRTPLMNAVDSHNWPAAEYLIYLNANLNLNQPVKNYAIFIAEICKNCSNKLLFLKNLFQFYDINTIIVGVYALPILLYFIQPENWDANVFDFLLANNIDFNIEYQGCNMLYYAIINNNLYATEKLFECGLEFKDKSIVPNQSLISFSTLQSTPELFTLLLNRGVYHDSDIYGNSIMHTIFSYNLPIKLSIISPRYIEYLEQS